MLLHPLNPVSSRLQVQHQLLKGEYPTCTCHMADDSTALREKGFSAADEKKIIALKDFIVKQAHASKA